MTIAAMGRGATGRNQRGRRVLEERRTALMAELRQDIHDAFAGVDTVCTHDTMDDIDASVATELTSVRFNVMQMKGDALVRIDEALIRIDDGRYGLCESCGAEISDARLSAMPFALRCTYCEGRKEDAEERRRRNAGLIERLRWES
jgi:DnaK suppressor protein